MWYHFIKVNERGGRVKLYKSIKDVFFKTPPRTIFTIYLILSIIGALLLWAPFSQKSGANVSFLDSLFICVSQISSTGLTPVSMVDNFNIVGGIISILILEIGGIGIVLLINAYWILIGKKIGRRERMMVAAEQNQFTLKGVLKLISNALIAILVFQLIYILVMVPYLYIKQPWDMNFLESIFHSIFLAASAFANAGLDWFPTNSSFIVFQEKGMYFPQIATMLLVFSGGVGYWPLADLTLWVKAKFKGERHKFSFISKLFTLLHLGTFLVSAVVLFGLEYHNTLIHMTPTRATFDVLFMANSARSAGYSNTDMMAWTNATKTFMSFLMFIGAAPNSAGGGIRLTTFILLISALYSHGRHRKQVFMGGKAIKREAVKRAYTVFSMGVIIVMFSVLAISIREPDLAFLDVFYQVSSAFGTVGLSLNVTPKLTIFSKMILIVVMFIGRIGILTFIEMIRNKKETTNLVTYAEIDMIVG